MRYRSAWIAFAIWAACDTELSGAPSRDAAPPDVASDAIADAVVADSADTSTASDDASTESELLRVTFEDRPFDTNGLTGARARLPARFISYSQLDERGAVVASGRSDADGALVRAANATSLVLEADAAFGAHRVEVLGERRAVYREEIPLRAGENTIALPGDASAPFHIADVALRGFESFASVVPTEEHVVSFLWRAGQPQACGSCYSSGRILLGGGEDDPDEWDDIIILHELGHDFVARYSQDNSPAGPHRDRIVSPPLAYGEGIAYMFAAAVDGSPTIVDTFGPSTPRFIDFEAMKMSGTDLPEFHGTASGTAEGDLREEIVEGLLWDLFDPANEPHDRVALGLPAFWDLMTKMAAWRPALDQGASDMDVADFLAAAVCIGGVSANDAALLAQERGFPWTAPNCALPSWDSLRAAKPVLLPAEE